MKHTRIYQNIVNIIERLEPTTRKIFAPIKKLYYRFYRLPPMWRTIIARAMTIFGLLNILNPLINGVIPLLAWVRLLSDKRYKKLVVRLRQARYERMSEEEINKHIIKTKRNKRRKKRRSYQKRRKTYIQGAIEPFQKGIHEAFHKKKEE